MKKLKSHIVTIPRRAPHARSAIVDRLSTLRRHVVNDVMRSVLFGCESLIASSSHVPRVPVFDSSHFDWVSKLESNVAHIQKEGLNVLSLGSSIPAFHEVSPDQERISQDERWRTFFLFGMGYGTPFAEELCPETVAILKSIPGMTSAFFSILAPGKHIPRHRGLFNGFVRCHLPIKVPSDAKNCRMTIADTSFHWKYGECVVFDDTFEHEVHNDTEETRVVLLVDVLRPMGLAGRLLTRTLTTLGKHTAYVQDAKRNNALFESRMRDTADALSLLNN